MSEIKETVHIDAPPAVVWSVMTDVEKWPEWTGTTRSLRLLTPGPLGPSSQARIQMQMTSTWTVTEYTEGRSFTWEAPALPGSRAVGSHAVEADGAGSKVTLSIAFTGPMAPLTSLLFGGMSRSNVRKEAEGLKRRAEALAKTEP